MVTGNHTITIADEFVLFEETGLKLSVGPNQTVHNDYDCKSILVHRENCDVNEVLFGLRSFIWVK